MNTPKLFVGNLPSGFTEEELRELFSESGTVISVTILKDKFTGYSKGFGFVEMEYIEEAETAIASFHDYRLSGRPMVVNEARPLVERSRRVGRF